MQFCRMMNYDALIHAHTLFYIELHIRAMVVTYWAACIKLVRIPTVHSASLRRILLLRDVGVGGGVVPHQDHCQVGCPSSR